MRTLKRVALMGTLSVAALAASASAASAITVSPAGTAVTFTAGATEFNAVIDVDCSASVVSGAVPGSPNNTGNPVNVGAISLSFTGCTGDSATITCSGVTMSVANNGTYNATASDADVRIGLPANSCTTGSAGCTLRIPRVATNVHGDAFNNGAGAATIVIPATSLTYDASGPFWCFDSSATWQANGGGSVTYTQSGGTALTVS